MKTTSSVPITAFMLSSLFQFYPPVNGGREGLKYPFALAQATATVSDSETVADQNSNTQNPKPVNREDASEAIFETFTKPETTESRKPTTAERRLKGPLKLYL